jgi:hypothetical protein
MAGKTDLADLFGAELAAALREADVPVLAGALQRQGDVLVLPLAAQPETAGLLRRRLAGLPVLAWPQGQERHVLHGDGRAWTRRVDTGVREVAYLSVPSGGAAFLMHPEHGALGIGPGWYAFRYQNEYDPDFRQWLPVGD